MPLIALATIEGIAAIEEPGSALFTTAPVPSVPVVPPLPTLQRARADVVVVPV